MEYRAGTGYDVHRLVAGRRLILGGVEIPFEKGLLGHSDADVLTHALMDALLGAAGKGDIGQHFPDTDERYRGVSSLKLLEAVKDIITADGYQLINADITLIAERPKIRNHIPAMKKNICKVLGTEEDRINIKGTTTEGLGPEGEGLGMACQAICILGK